MVGRDREREALGELIATARHGCGGTLILRGDAGIGKTALLDLAVHKARMRTVRASGYESEADLPFATLGDLLRPLLDQLDRIPPLQAESLRTALGLGTTGGVDPVSVEVATTNLVRTVGGREPMLVVVDDMQWVDSASLSSLVHLARRTGDVPIAFVAAARTDDMGSAVDTLPSLPLEPLSAPEAETLLRTSAPDTAPSVVRALVGAAGGNPLALHELLHGLSSDQRAGHLSIVEPIAVSTEVVLPFRRRVDALPASTRQAMLIAAAEGRGHLDRVLDALSRASLDIDAFEPAERQGLVALTGDAVTFRHPLVRSTVYQTATPDARRAAHGLLAAVEPDPDRRAWHLGSSVARPDPAARAALVEMASRALARGADATAARALARAAELSADAVDRGRTYAKAARAANRSGDLGAAARLGALAEPLIGNDPIEQADLTLLNADLRMRRGEFDAAYRDLAQHAEAIAAVDPRRAMTMLLFTGKLHVYKMESTLALRTVDRALELAAGQPRDVLQMSSLGMTQTMAGHPDALRTAKAAAAAGLTGKRGHLHALGIAWPLVWLEEYELAERFISAAVRIQRDGGYHSFLGQSLSPGAELAFRVGRWLDAHAAATEACQLLVETNQPADAAIAASTLARIEASRGADADCIEHASRAFEGDRASGMRAATAFAEAALGHLALGHRRFGEAITHLSRAHEIATSGGLGEPGLLPVHADLAESLIRSGNAVAAGAVIDELEQLATSTGRESALAAAARCRGLLAPADSFTDSFERALAHHGRTSNPFERARTELCFGERLRRAHTRGQARRHLRLAMELFESLGAVPWAALAAAELRVAGDAVTVSSVGAELTPREEQVARLVANGATNKEVAIDLFLNAKTVEFHLGNVYRKLGVRSRSELARVFPRA
ncbi:MAG TPA: AAA family ATPase [Ilumatobacteraceae bacterium]